MMLVRLSNRLVFLLALQKLAEELERSELIDKERVRLSDSIIC